MQKLMISDTTSIVVPRETASTDMMLFGDQSEKCSLSPCQIGYNPPISQCVLLTLLFFQLSVYQVFLIVMPW